MNYKKHYNNLISRAKDRILNEFTEKHHIIPKCLGGDNSKENLVCLTPEEHYIAHQLLVKLHPKNQGLSFAAVKMCSDKDGNRINNKLYKWIRIKNAKLTSEKLKLKHRLGELSKSGENNPMYGKCHSDITKQKMKKPKSDKTKAKMSETKKRLLNEEKITLSGENNPMYGKCHSDDAKLKQSLARKGKRFTIEHKEKLSNSLENQYVNGTRSSKGEKNPFFNKHHSIETKKLLSKKAKEQVKVKCPNCEIFGNIGNMRRWHFDNCKNYSKV